MKKNTCEFIPVCYKLYCVLFGETHLEIANRFFLSFIRQDDGGRSNVKIFEID